MALYHDEVLSGEHLSGKYLGKLRRETLIPLLLDRKAEMVILRKGKRRGREWSHLYNKKRGAKRPGDSAQHLALNGINAVANQLGTQSAEEADEEHSNHKPLLSELEVSSPRYNALLRV